MRRPRPTRARRGRVDDEDNLWFAEYGGNAIGKFDPRTETITEWRLPTPHSDPYDVVRAKTGEVWAGSMVTDQVDRLDPAPAPSLNICCRTTPTSAGCSWTIPRIRQCYGLATITAHRLSRSSQWIRRPPTRAWIASPLLRFGLATTAYSPASPRRGPQPPSSPGVPGMIRGFKANDHVGEISCVA